MNSIDLNKLNSQDLYSISTALLYALRDQPQFSVISELPYILDHDNFMNFIKYYAGMTIKVPTLEEIYKTSRILLLYQYYKVNSLSWKDALLKSGFTEEESLSAKTKLQLLEKTLKEQEVGGRFYE